MKKLNFLNKGIVLTARHQKLRKIKATKKNRNENGNRLSSFVENPHSNGLFISRSNKIFFPKICVTKKTKNAKIMLWHK